MYYVYILLSLKDKKLYVGFTGDLRKRLKEHNEGLSFSTKGRRPFSLIYYEAYRNRKDAMAKEKFLKTGWGRNYIKRALRNYFQEINNIQKVGRERTTNGLNRHNESNEQDEHNELK